MSKEDIKIGDILYWNTTGAYDTKISLRCTVLDIGQKYIWIMVFGNLSPTPIKEDKLSREPLYKITNKGVKYENTIRYERDC